MTFYKIVDGLPQVGSGTRAPEGFFAYDTENPPKELTDALATQKAQQDKEQIIRDAKQYLADTDWIIAKISEAQVNGEDLTSLQKKYKKELKNRKDARKKINKEK